MAGFAGLGAALRTSGRAKTSKENRIKSTQWMLSAATALGVIGLGSATAGATTFAVEKPSSTAANVALSGLTLTASSPVIFDYKLPTLIGLGDLAAKWSLTATETGAISFGPITLGSFDGSFSYTYTGATKTAGGITVHTGDNLLDGKFLGAVFTGYGSSASLQDSNLAGGLVSYNNNAFLSFGMVGDEALSLALTSIKPSVLVVGGKLTAFSGVASASYSADAVTGIGLGTPGGGLVGHTAAPEPATWSILAAGLLGLAGVRRAARRKQAIQSA